jgi:hypothetical protein
MIRVARNMGLLANWMILLNKSNVRSNKCQLNNGESTLCLKIGDLYVILRRY